MSSLPLPDHGKFYDLNVPYENETSASKRMSMLVQLGYEVVAFSTFMESKTNQTKKKKFFIPTPPPKVPVNLEMMKYFRTYNTSLMQLSRLTIELREMDDLIKVRDAINFDAYDIIAVVPCNEQLFHQSCNDLNVDIISLDCTSTFTFIPTFTLLSSANKRGICFEICYSPMIRDNSIRNCTVSNAQKLSRVRKFSNLILSSGCMNPMELRGPYDVANLNCLFALPESSYIHTVSKHCRAAVVHGFIRKTANGAVYVQKLTREDKWRIEQKEKKEMETLTSFTEEKPEKVDKSEQKLDILPKGKQKKRKSKKLSQSVTEATSATDKNVESTVTPKTSDDVALNESKTAKKRKKAALKTSPQKDNTEKENTVEITTASTKKKKKGKKRKLESL